MKRRIVISSDGSHTIRIDEWDEQYHSKHGAVAESQHVFIDQGLSQFKVPNISILEMGFGTGLNALMSLIYATDHDLYIEYTAIEAHPVSEEIWSELNYPQVLNAQPFENAFQLMHKAEWGTNIQITDRFHLTKIKTDMTHYKETDRYQLIYYDAFGYRVQPDLWTESIFRNMYQSLKDGGILVTYAAKGSVRRAMQTAGFKVERLPGPPGKREMLRAGKIHESEN